MLSLNFKEALVNKEINNSSLSVAIGVFDGFHLGHQEILSRLLSKNKNSKTAIITFNINPKNKKSKMLTTLKLKEEFAKKFNVNYFIVIDFLSNISNISGSEFLSLLCTMCRLKSVVVGEDFKCGTLNKQITADMLQKEALLLGYDIDVDIINTIKSNNGIRISTTWLIELIETKGDFESFFNFTKRDYIVDFNNLDYKINNTSLTIKKELFLQVLPPCGSYKCKLSYFDSSTSINDVLITNEEVVVLNICKFNIDILKFLTKEY